MLANHNTAPAIYIPRIAVEDTNLLANHNEGTAIMENRQAVEDTNLLANHNGFLILESCP